jgi:hypothetical protein
MEDSSMISMADIISSRAPVQKSQKTERGELLSYFSTKLDKKIPYVAFKLTMIPTEDLYFIKSNCDDYERRGGIWAKAFYGSLKPHDT